MLRRYINNHLQSKIKNKNEVSILFSGGLDSLSILFSCLDLKIEPHLYTFYLKNYESEDILTSRKIANIYNLQLTEVIIDDEDINKLIKDVKYIIQNFKIYKKTHVQCVYPFLYIIPKIKEKYVLSGLCADDLYGTSRSMAKHYKNIESFNNIRNEKINNLNSSAYLQIRTLVESYDKVFITPYKEDKNILNYFSALNYKAMNSPKQKNIMYLDYKNEIDKNKLYRRNNSLQCCSHIREWHDKLLNTKLNTNNYKIINPIYKNLYKILVLKEME